MGSKKPGRHPLTCWGIHVRLSDHTRAPHLFGKLRVKGIQPLGLRDDKKILLALALTQMLHNVVKTGRNTVSRGFVLRSSDECLGTGDSKVSDQKLDGSLFVRIQT